MDVSTFWKSLNNRFLNPVTIYTASYHHSKLEIYRNYSSYFLRTERPTYPKYSEALHLKIVNFRYAARSLMKVLGVDESRLIILKPGKDGLFKTSDILQVVFLYEG